MQKQNSKQGKIIPNGVSLEKHENDIVVVFTELGHDVELIPYGHEPGQKTADAVIDGLEWEFKTVYGNNTRTIDHLIRKATKQSENIILDLRQMAIPQTIALRKVRFLVEHNRNVKKLKVVVKPKKVIDIK